MPWSLSWRMQTLYGRHRDLIFHVFSSFYPFRSGCIKKEIYPVYIGSTRNLQVPVHVIWYKPRWTHRLSRIVGPYFHFASLSWIFHDVSRLFSKLFLMSVLRIFGRVFPVIAGSVQSCVIVVFKSVIDVRYKKSDRTTSR